MRPFVLVLCLATSLAAFAQETRYRLERILVEGSNISEDIIRGEARLDEEQTYTEEQFRQAVYRIRRLPFVTDAVYRIETGVAGGTQLVIRILDTSPIFYEADAGGVRDSAGETDQNFSLLLGGRWLLDNLGVIEGAVRDGKDEDGIQAGVAYRAYDIYGTGATASLAIATRFKTDERTYDPEAVLTAGWPIGQKQTITLSASRSKSRISRVFDVNGDDDTDDDDDTDLDDNEDLTDRDRFTFAELRWSYESIDDPFFATRGVSFSAGPRYFNAEKSVQSWDDEEEEVVSTDTKETSYGAVLDVAAYRALAGRSVGFLRLSGDGSRADESEVEIVNGAARAGVAFDFHSNAPNVLRPWKSRIELGGGYRSHSFKVPDGLEITSDGAFAEVAFLLRHRWGRVRLSGVYELE